LLALLAVPVVAAGRLAELRAFEVEGVLAVGTGNEHVVWNEGTHFAGKTCLGVLCVADRGR
jgi:hypothetical protein